MRAKYLDRVGSVGPRTRFRVRSVAIARPSFGCTNATRPPDGLGAVEAESALCQECTEGVGPSELEHAYANYEFRVDPVAEAFGMETLQ